MQLAFHDADTPAATVPSLSLIDDALATPLPCVEECVWKLFQLSPATGSAPKSAEPLTVLKAESPGFVGESLGPAKLIEIDFALSASATPDAMQSNMTMDLSFIMAFPFVFTFVSAILN